MSHHEESTAEPVDYRLAPAVAARLMGLGLVGLAVLVFVATLVVAVTGLPADLLVVVLVLGLAAVLSLGWWLRSRAYVVRCGPTGYRVRLVRGAGVTEARWSLVEDAVTVTRHGVACVELRLKDGRRTTIPVTVLAIDREQFVRELQVHLQRGQRLRRLGGG
ncbi:hypothetical protein [Nocardioides sp. SYSU D00038]|uniref:hypothetical protein n=1 Tax=Nocardioides sp. SYSU D00038 TaxID=2812554 RepID=UPI0027DB6B80|nr:hypothetical protein [Nocardioides sp. SYSU D00038]